MAIATTPETSLRLEDAETSRLSWAFIVSLALHLLIAGTYYVGHEYGWWKNLHWPGWVKSRMLTELFQKPKEQPQEQQQIEVPLVFVDVSPAQATTEAPKQTPYYSSKNSIAANPEPAVDSNVPKIDGKQTDMVKTEDVPRSKAFPLNPSVPNDQTEKAKENEPQENPKPIFTPGDFLIAKPEVIEHKNDGNVERPRTLAQARAQLPAGSQLPGPKMKQDGSVRHQGNVALDVQGSPFGDYDGRLIYAVQRSWDSLLESRQYAGEQTGKVTIHFRLHSD
jgi:hypothetical protein